MSLELKINTDKCPRCGGQHINMRFEEVGDDTNEDKNLTSICPHTQETIYITVKTTTR